MGGSPQGRIKRDGQHGRHHHRQCLGIRQEQTAERVLIHVDTELGAKDLQNNRMAYVSVSRGQWDAQIFTNDREKLPEPLSHDVSHQSAYKPEQAIASIQQKM